MGLTLTHRRIVLAAVASAMVIGDAWYYWKATHRPQVSFHIDLPMESITIEGSETASLPQFDRASGRWVNNMSTIESPKSKLWPEEDGKLSFDAWEGGSLAHPIKPRSIFRFRVAPDATLEDMQQSVFDLAKNGLCNFAVYYPSSSGDWTKHPPVFYGEISDVRDPKGALHKCDLAKDVAYPFVRPGIL